MSQTEGPVPPTHPPAPSVRPHAAAAPPGDAPSVKSLLRRPFKVNLGATAEATAPVPTPPTAMKPATPTPSAKAVRAVRRPLAHSGHQSVGHDDHTTAEPARTATHLSREQILAVTADCLAEAGYDGTTIRKIAKRLDCAVGSIYRYYTDKRELLDAVVQDRFLEVAQNVDAGLHPDTTARQYLAAARSGPEQYRLMFWLAAVGRAPDQPAAVPPVIQRILDGWAKQLDGNNAANRRWALLHGQAMLGVELECDDLPDVRDAHHPAATATT